jgi:UDP-glucose 4-epimerase
MRCLVTGASGHLGSHLTRLLLARGHSVTVLIRESSDLWRLEGVIDRIGIIRSDLADIASAADEILAAAAETVFHLAWSGVTADTRNLPRNLIANVSGSLQLFQLAHAAGCICWIGLGSQAEYGTRAEVLHEDLAPCPDTPYGVAKLSLSRMLETLCAQTGIRYVWLRLLATYGPMDDVRHLIPSVIEKLVVRCHPSLTSGTQEWDYLYVEDAADAIYRCAVTTGVHGIYNLASGSPCAVRKIAERIRDMIDPSLPVTFGNTSVMSLRARIDKLQDATGWFPQTALDDGLRKTVEWHRNKSLRI